MKHSIHRPLRILTSLAGLGIVLLSMSGCGGGVSAPASSPTGLTLQGKVLAGQAAVAGTSVSIYAAGASGNAEGATSLAENVTTDATGGFSLAGISCPATSTQVYVTARGGIPAGAAGKTNAALLYMSALGSCGNLESVGSVVVNEETTVASVWPLAQFLGQSAVMGASVTNATGLQNAFSVVGNLVNANTGLASGAILPQGARSEVAKLNAMANALSACGNSDGTACATLFMATTIAGQTPANTLDATLAVIRNPSLNVTGVYAATKLATTFGPALTKAPNDWTMSLTYGACTSGCGGLNLPGGLAIDGSGSAWVANYFGAVVSEFLANGRAAAANGFSGEGLRESYGIAVDAQNNVWVANEQSITGANNSHHGSVSEFSSSGAELSGYGYIGGGIYYPQAVAADSNGDIWVADYGNSSASLLASNGSAISGGAGFAPSGLPFVTGVALDGSHNAWFAAQGEAVRVSPQGNASSFACCSSDPAGIAVDQMDNVWVADAGASEVAELNSSGTVLHFISLDGGADSPQGVAVDGAGTVWTANYLGDSMTAINGSTAAVVSPAPGFGLDAGLDEPYGIAVDASGAVWVSNSGNNTVTAFPGLASPIRTPLLGPPAQP